MPLQRSPRFRDEQIEIRGNRATNCRVLPERTDNPGGTTVGGPSCLRLPLVSRTGLYGFARSAGIPRGESSPLRRPSSGLSVLPEPGEVDLRLLIETVEGRVAVFRQLSGLLREERVHLHDCGAQQEQKHGRHQAERDGNQHPE